MSIEDKITAVALCAGGAEKAVSLELKKLGLAVLGTGFGKARFQTDLAGLYRSLMGLRAADRVFLEAARFLAEDFDALFAKTSAVSWETLIPKGMGLRISKVRTNRSRLHAAASVQGMVHKAVADRLCKQYRFSRVPAYGKSAELRVYIEKDQVSLLLDISGEPLFKRGYRREGGVAPLRETTAAAMLLLADWRRKFLLYDPFCGSGTIGIEAAMYAWDMAPGLGRGFALSDFLIGNQEIEQEVRKELFKKVDFSRTIRIYGSDEDSRAVALAGSNAERAYELAQGRSISERGILLQERLPWLPDFKVLSLRDAKAPDKEGVIITNPPYGKRLGTIESAETTYRTMERLTRNFPGWKLGLITDHPGFESFFGKKASSCREITNGAIQSYFFQYENI
ncbi:MAG: class I SAM-dependent RNA methyltransferase [Treponema sp.]|jgi:putative N6-adenine-specific DNA methylase|nr:class I SAM-dependent RNA methyltransferase [Treponema sp.]